MQVKIYSENCFEWNLGITETWHYQKAFTAPRVSGVPRIQISVTHIYIYIYIKKTAFDGKNFGPWLFRHR